MNHSFGPWTIAMDGGSGAQLRMFWKQRMAMLPIVRHSPTVVTGRGRLLLAATATLALVLPTLQRSRTAAAVEVEPEKLAAVGKPFRLVLPAGLVAEVIGVNLLMDGGPATVYGPRALAAFDEFAAPAE